jgi:uncharacterized protein YndB with AHSA1/START domain
MPLGTASEDFATMAGAGTLVIQRWLPGPVERVWRYLVESELRKQWLAAGEMDLRSGAALELAWRNDGLSVASDPRPTGLPEVQRLQSRVIAVDPPHLLTIAWGGGEVSFALVEQGGRVRLTVTHSGLDAVPARAEIAGGWHMHLDILQARLSGQAAGSFWSGWAGLRDHYARQDLEAGGRA